MSLFLFFILAKVDDILHILSKGNLASINTVSNSIPRKTKQVQSCSVFSSLVRTPLSTVSMFVYFCVVWRINLRTASQDQNAM